MALTDRRSPVAVALALANGFALGLAWAVGCPWLAGLEHVPWRAAWLAGGVLVGAVAALVAPGGVLGSAGAARSTLTLLALSTAGALVGALGCVREMSGPLALALGLATLGAGAALALVSGGVAYQIDRRRHPHADEIDAPGVPLRPLVATVCGALALAGWSLAAGHVIGQRSGEAAQQAVAEARDLAAIAAERLLSDASATLDSFAPQLTPAGGFLVETDARGQVRAGVGAALSEDSHVEVNEGPPTTCRLRRRAEPCGVRNLPSGDRIIAAVPVQPIGAGLVLAFLFAGLVAVSLAVAVGGLIGAAYARDLDRVAQRIDELRRSAKGQKTPNLANADRPVVVASVDEIGRLAAALGQLRTHLMPMITEYRKALERSQAADQARDQFLKLVSVELRSPLDRIIDIANVMLVDAVDPLTPEQKDDVKTVLAASRQLTELIDEVLDVSAIATGQVQLKVANVDIGALVNEVVKIQRPIVQKKGVEVRLAVDDPSPEAIADARRLRQVVTNIISNAVKFTDQGSIDISVRVGGGNVEISVKDTGPGIAPEQLPKLFREFVQLGSLKQRAHGTGLGLAICKRLVEAHGGEVLAQSTVGAGSTFSIRVPIAGPPQKVIDDTPVQGVPALS